MLGSYAAHDHRKKVDKEKKACIDFPRLPSGTAVAGCMVTYPIAEATPPSRKE